MKTTALRLALLSSSMLLAACSSVPLDDADSGRAGAGGSGAVTEVIAQGRSGESALPVERLRAAGFNDAGQASIFFGFDGTTIAPEYQPLLQKTAELLRSGSNRFLIIEGNTDERGTAEYNIALGQRRSETVKQALKVLGAPESQMEANTNGEEKPLAPGRDEASYQKNRRADLFIQ